MPRRSKPKIGRPSLGDSARTIVVPVKFSQDEIDAIDAAAKRAEASRSAVIREPALAAAGFVFCRWCESRTHRWCCRTCGEALESDAGTCSAACREALHEKEDKEWDEYKRALARI